VSLEFEAQGIFCQDLKLAFSCHEKNLPLLPCFDLKEMSFRTEAGMLVRKPSPWQKWAWNTVCHRNAHSPGPSPAAGKVK